MHSHTQDVKGIRTIQECTWVLNGMYGAKKKYLSTSLGTVLAVFRTITYFDPISCSDVQ